MDAQLQLDAFQREYEQFHARHNELVAGGQGIAKEINELDSIMFGEKSSMHPAVVCVEELVKRLEKSVRSMDEIAAPQLQQFKDCLQFYLLEQRGNRVCVSHEAQPYVTFKLWPSRKKNVWGRSRDEILVLPMGGKASK